MKNEIISIRTWWIIIICYILSIYISLPFMRDLLTFLYTHFEKNQLILFINLIFISITFIILRSLYKKGIRKLLFTIPILALIIYFIFQIEIPEERIHFIQYGILGIMSLFVFGTTLQGIIKSILFTAAAGTIDEIIQYYLPNRVGDIRDVVFNAIGGILGVITGKLTIQERIKNV